MTKKFKFSNLFSMQSIKFAARMIITGTISAIALYNILDEPDSIPQKISNDDLDWVKKTLHESGPYNQSHIYHYLDSVDIFLASNRHMYNLGAEAYYITRKSNKRTGRGEIYLKQKEMRKRSSGVIRDIAHEITHTAQDFAGIYDISDSLYNRGDFLAGYLVHVATEAHAGTNGMLVFDLYGLNRNDTLVMRQAFLLNYDSEFTDYKHHRTPLAVILAEANDDFSDKGDAAELWYTALAKIDSLCLFPGLASGFMYYVPDNAGEFASMRSKTTTIENGSYSETYQAKFVSNKDALSLIQRKILTKQKD